MDKYTEHNPCAFPVNSPEQGEFGLCNEGMSLRDYFAGQAITGLLASSAGVSGYGPQAAARDAYLMATALLAERAKIEVDK